MASQYVSTRAAAGPAVPDAADPTASAWDEDPTVSIPRWLMVLAARGEVTLRVQVDLEDDPIGDFDDTATKD